jgi:hypothetical protein
MCTVTGFPWIWENPTLDFHWLWNGISQWQRSLVLFSSGVPRYLTRMCLTPYTAWIALSTSLTCNPSFKAHFLPGLECLDPPGFLCQWDSWNNYYWVLWLNMHHLLSEFTSECNSYLLMGLPAPSEQGWDLLLHRSHRCLPLGGPHTSDEVFFRNEWAKLGFNIMWLKSKSKRRKKWEQITSPHLKFSVLF